MYRGFTYNAVHMMRRGGRSFNVFQGKFSFGPVVRPSVYFQVAALSSVGSGAGDNAILLAGEGAPLPSTLDGDGEDDETRFKAGPPTGGSTLALEKDRDRGPAGAAAAAAAAAEGGAGAAAAPPGLFGVDFSSGEEDEEDEGGSGQRSDSDDDAEVAAGRGLVSGGLGAVKRALAGNLNDEPYLGPLRSVAAGRGGAASRALRRHRAGAQQQQPSSGTPDAALAALFPLDEGAAARELAGPSPAQRAAAPSFGVPRPATPAQRAEHVARAVIARRALRAVYSASQLEEAAAAAMLLHGSDMDGFPLTPGHDAYNVMGARRDSDYRPGEDPLTNSALPFDPKGVTVSSNMSWNAAPGALNIDIKVTLVARLRQLGLAADALPYLRLVVGPRYHAGRDEVRFSSQAHGTATANKRQVLERLVGAVKASMELLKKHGPLEKLPVFPAYKKGRTDKFFL